jgi:Aminoglycoside-2''-adenylyltransferase
VTSPDEPPWPADGGSSEDQLQFQRLYGPWQAWSPAEAAEVLDPLGVTWWVAGGHAIEAYTGARRAHEDLDVSIFRLDLEKLRTAIAGRYHVWAAGPHGLCPLDDKRNTMPDEAEQVWLRAHSLAPWRVDVLLNPDRDGAWVFKREPEFIAPLESVTLQRDGIRYLRPEIALAFKAKLRRPKDEADFAATVSLLDDADASWLAEFLDRQHPDHPWRARLSASRSIESDIRQPNP